LWQTVRIGPQLLKIAGSFAVSDQRTILPRGRYCRRGRPRKFSKRSVTFRSKSGVPDFPKNVGLRKRTIGVGGLETNSE